MRSERFEAEVVEGHKGVVVALVPFDPAVAWRRPPVRLAGRRHGWPVRGTVNGVAFTGYVGERWGRFFVILDEELREASAVAPGDRVRVTLAFSSSPEALAKAVEQSKVTTQPSKVRPDAIGPTRSWAHGEQSRCPDRGVVLARDEDDVSKSPLNRRGTSR